MKDIPKLITILGPTACGKSSLGIELAQKCSGEIVSADSRQVYQGLDIGSGKVTLDEQSIVPHHLLDVINPGESFSVVDFQKLAFSAIDDIISRGRLPFLVGGTALYIYAVIDNYLFDDVSVDLERRKDLEKKTIPELQEILNSVIAKNRIVGAENFLPLQCKCVAHNDILNPDDWINPRRLIRAIEKLEAGASLTQKKGRPRYDNLIFGIDIPRQELYARIDKRVDERVKQGMIEEVANLRKAGVSDEWLLSLGLEYRFITEYLLHKWGSQDEMLERLKTAIHAFSRRQMTWWRRDKRIVWIKNKEEAHTAILTHS